MMKNMTISSTDPAHRTRIPSERLSELETCWSSIRSAHEPGPQGEASMRDLIGRYHDAVSRYIHLKIRDAHLADEVLQEFWTKLLSGKLAGADQTKGRFRDYLRTVLHRLIIDHFRGRKLQPLPPGEIFDPSEPDHDYDQVWRDAVISRVWARLEIFEKTTAKNRYATVLKLRMADSKASIDELSERLSERSGRAISPEAFRKTLQRARSKFLELLIQELRETMNLASAEELESEIFDLGLGSLYKKVQTQN